MLEYIEDMLENLDIASRVEILRSFDESILYKLMHKYDIPSSLDSGTGDDSVKLIDKFLRINIESKELISDKDLGEFYHFPFSISIKLNYKRSKNKNITK